MDHIRSIRQIEAVPESDQFDLEELLWGDESQGGDPELRSYWWPL